MIKKKQPNKKSPLHFTRFEFKYVLSEAKRTVVEKDICHFVELDPFVTNIPGSEYVVRSLYYDDSSYSCFYDKIDGVCTRSKFRIRTYPNECGEPSPVFLEIKGRHNNLVFKHRTPANNLGYDWSELKGDELSRTILCHIDESHIKDQFNYELSRKRIAPITLIDYRRRPYISKLNPDFRITFDQSLTARQTDRLIPDGHTTSMKVAAGYTILEVKFLHHMPSWFHRIIQVHELIRVSVSKICAGMETLGIAIDENG